MDIPRVYISNDVKIVRELLPDILDSYISFETVGAVFNYIASRIFHAKETSFPAINVLVNNHLPRDTAFNLDVKLDRTTTELIAARSLGFVDLAEFKEQKERKINHVFYSLIDLFLAGDITRFEKLLRLHPEFIFYKSAFGHRAGLIHYVGSNGVEIWKQVVPSNLEQSLEILLKFGADPNQENMLYGNTNLKTLIETSAHPRDCNKIKSLIAILENQNHN